MTYAKLIDGNRIEYAPKNKDNILNFNLNLELLEADGYKPLIVAERPYNQPFVLTYEETADSIIEHIEVAPPDPGAVARQNQEQFEKEFFETSQGWIRKKVNMQDGSQKDFITDCLPVIKSFLTNEGLPSESFIFYNLPDFAHTDILSPQFSPALNLAEANQFFAECCLEFKKQFFGN